MVVSNDNSTRCEKDTMSGSQKLLQRPSSLEPFTRRKQARIPSPVVVKVDVALSALFIPPVHGIDHFCELGTTALVDAASVYPSVTKASLLHDTAEVYNFLIRGATLDQLAALAVFFVSDFCRAPSMREDRVRFVRKIWEFAELQSFGVKYAHRKRFVRRRDDMVVIVGEARPSGLGDGSKIWWWWSPAVAQGLHIAQPLQASTHGMVASLLRMTILWWESASRLRASMGGTVVQESKHLTFWLWVEIYRHESMPKKMEVALTAMLLPEASPFD